MTLIGNDPELMSVYDKLAMDGTQGYKVLGYYADEIDGQFGAGTKAAVIDFQKANGLEADGMVGSETKAILYSPQAKPKTE